MTRTYIIIRLEWKYIFKNGTNAGVVSAVQIIKYWLGWPNSWNSLNNCVIVLFLYGLLVCFNVVYFQSHTFSGTRHKFLHRIHFDLWSVVFKDMAGVQNIHQENPTNGRYWVKTKYTIRVSVWFHRAHCILVYLWSNILPIYMCVFK